MYLAHSALRTSTKNGKHQPAGTELQIRLEAHRAACEKYRQEITAIQKYLPGWLPPFEVNSNR